MLRGFCYGSHHLPGDHANIELERRESVPDRTLTVKLLVRKVYRIHFHEKSSEKESKPTKEELILSEKTEST